MDPEAEGYELFPESNDLECEEGVEGGEDDGSGYDEPGEHSSPPWSL